MSSFSTPKVSIIITSYFEKSKAYLELCLKSVRNLAYPKDAIEIIVVGRKDYLPRFEGVKTVSPNEVKFWPPVGLNYGIMKATGEYIFVLNDDTICTRNSLSNLVYTLENNPQVGLVMPISNDQQSRYMADVGISARPYKLGELEPRASELMDHWSQYAPALSYHQTLCIYAFLMKRSVYFDVGPFDEKLIGQDDIDYTLRIGQKGYLNAIAYHAIVYHFGGVSADQTFSAETREKSMQLFNDKWVSALHPPRP